MTNRFSVKTARLASCAVIDLKNADLEPPEDATGRCGNGQAPPSDHPCVTAATCGSGSSSRFVVDLSVRIRRLFDDTCGEKKGSVIRPRIEYVAGNDVEVTWVCNVR